MNKLEQIASQVRRDIIRMVHGASSGHPGGSLGATDILTALYFEVMNISVEPFNMNAKNEDVFYLSNGHISPAWYSVLARKGYFPISELSTFRKLNTRLQGHPTSIDKLPGIRIASGSLGQGLSVALGHAIAKKMDNDNSTVYVLMGDGEIQEGQIWEAAIFGGSKKVDNIIAVIDYNGQQIDGSTEQVMPLGNIRQKWESFGWKVIDANGNDMQEILSAFAEAKQMLGKQQAILIIMHTDMGFGVDFMTGTHTWHGIAPNDTEAEKALSQLEETLGDY